MLVSGINDHPEHIKKLKEAIDRINPDKVQLNSPVRTTTEPGILPVTKDKLEQIRGILGPKCEII
jgi:wyosine [tRNA(Phe)-imidazoG37] synthetase (radical SAM superfamily)